MLSVFSIAQQNVLMLFLTSVKAYVQRGALNEHPGVVGCGDGVVYLTSPGRPTDIGLQLGRA